jgi:hypothetical protein
MAARTIAAHEEEKGNLRQTLEQKRYVTRQFGESVQSVQEVIPERKVPPYRATYDLATKKQVSLPLTCTIQ